MALAGFTCKKPIELLTQDEKETIHEKSLEILKNTGAVFKWQPALKVLKEAGCNVDFESQVVKFPQDVVMDALKSCPSSFIVRGRDPKYEIELAPDTVYFVNQPGPAIYNFETGVKRTGTVRDLAEMTRICDALENIHSILPAILTIADRPPEVGFEWANATMLRNSTKSPVLPGGIFAIQWMIELAKAAGIQPMGGCTCEPPLTYSADQCDTLIRLAKEGWGTWFDTGGGSGATSPATLAGTVLQVNTELMAGLVLQQVVNPGVGIMYGTMATPLDMRSGHMAIGIEGYMVAAALAGMSRFYNIPCSSFDSLTGGKSPTDQQVGYEKAMSYIMLAQAGVNYIIGAGGIDGQSCVSIEQLVIDNEIFGMIGRYLQGITVNEETLAADLIEKVGPIPGNFLTEAHTKKWWKKEQYLPNLNYRLSFEEWQQAGSKDVAARAKERADELLRTHEVPPLPEDVDREVSRILQAAEKEKVKS
jgi:trimethylamine--corrinoid protein Co-methyltransferase